MNKLMVLGLAVPLALSACKKEEAATKPAEKGKEMPKAPEPKKPEPPKTLTGADLGKWYVDRWAAWGPGRGKVEARRHPAFVEITEKITGIFLARGVLHGAGQAVPQGGKT